MARRGTLLRVVVAIALALAAAAATAAHAAGPSPITTGTQHVQVVGDGGVVLDGYLRRPSVPAGTHVPVIVWSSPYFGTVAPVASNPTAERQYENTGFSADFYVAHGYAVAMLNSRGTGHSQGCLEFFGRGEQ